MTPEALRAALEAEVAHLAWTDDETGVDLALVGFRYAIRRAVDRSTEAGVVDASELGRLDAIAAKAEGK